MNQHWNREIREPREKDWPGTRAAPRLMSETLPHPAEAASREKTRSRKPEAKGHFFGLR